MDPTPFHDLPRPDDGQTPWGDDYREAMEILDAKLPFVQATLWGFGNAANTPIATTQTYVAPVITTEGSSPCGCVEFPGGPRLDYINGTPRIGNVVATLTLDPDGNNKVFRVALFKNGTLVESAQGRVRIGAGGDVAQATVHGIVELEQGDELELRVGNWTDVTDVVVIDLSLSLRA
jgi:hypothetical protein